MLECLQCNDEFQQQSNELFCSYDCRTKFWQHKALHKKSVTTAHVDDLKFIVEKFRADTKNLEWHFKRINQEYEDWEDRCVKIEKCIRALEEVIEIEEEEINNIKQQREVDFDAMDELFSVE